MNLRSDFNMRINTLLGEFPPFNCNFKQILKIKQNKI